MKESKNKTFHITIKGNEQNKSEIVYNNMIQNMEELKLSKDEQIAYLTHCLTNIESEYANRFSLGSAIVIGFCGIILGLYFMFISWMCLGCIVIIASFICVLIRCAFVVKRMLKINRSDRFDQVEQIRSTLNKKLK